MMFTLNSVLLLLEKLKFCNSEKELEFAYSFASSQSYTGVNESVLACAFCKLGGI